MYHVAAATASLRKVSVLVATLALLKGIQLSTAFVSTQTYANSADHAISRGCRTALDVVQRRHMLSTAGAALAASTSASDVSAKDTSFPTNEVVRTVRGIRHRRLGGKNTRNDSIVVSEMGLGTQRWMSTDFNAPDRDLCFAMMDRAILEGGINLIDTAEQYPIPSGGGSSREGETERVIGDWMRERKIARDKVVIATKITGGRHVTPANIRRDCEESLQRLRTDRIDVYQLHWPQRYSPQSNWGQSLMYNIDNDKYWRAGQGEPTSFPDLCQAMQELIDDGKIRSWGLCNDNAYGLTASTRTAVALGTTPPCCLQGDFSLVDRKSEENGVAEAASPYNENVGFLAYNGLAGGMLTGKYSLDAPAAPDVPNRLQALALLAKPRGRMDTRGWGGTLYRYRTTAVKEAIVEYQAIVDRHGKEVSSLTELALRWNRQRTLVTSTLVGHSNMEQLEECLRHFCNTKPLSPDVMWQIDRVHMKNRLPIFSHDSVGADWFGEGEIGEMIP